MTQELENKTATSTEWGTYAKNFTTKFMVNVDLTYWTSAQQKFVTWKFHVDEYTEGRYGMIINIQIRKGRLT